VPEDVVPFDSIVVPFDAGVAPVVVPEVHDFIPPGPEEPPAPPLPIEY
jgi:hypothetical protein